MRRKKMPFSAKNEIGALKLKSFSWDILLAKYAFFQ